MIGATQLTPITQDIISIGVSVSILGFWHLMLKYTRVYKVLGL